MWFKHNNYVKSFVCHSTGAPRGSFLNSRAGGGGVNPHFNNLAALDCFSSFLHSLFTATACRVILFSDASGVFSFLPRVLC